MVSYIKAKKMYKSLKDIQNYTYSSNTLPCTDILRMDSQHDHPCICPKVGLAREFKAAPKSNFHHVDSSKNDAFQHSDDTL